VLVEVGDADRAAPGETIVHIAASSSANDAVQCGGAPSHDGSIAADIEGEAGRLLKRQIALRSDIRRAVVEEVGAGDVCAPRIEGNGLGEALQSEVTRECAGGAAHREDDVAAQRLAEAEQHLLARVIERRLLCVVIEAAAVVQAYFRVAPTFRAADSPR